MFLCACVPLIKCLLLKQISLGSRYIVWPASRISCSLQCIYFTAYVFCATDICIWIQKLTFLAHRTLPPMIGQLYRVRQQSDTPLAYEFSCYICITFANSCTPSFAFIKWCHYSVFFSRKPTNWWVGRNLHRQITMHHQFGETRRRSTVAPSESPPVTSQYLSIIRFAQRVIVLASLKVDSYVHHVVTS